MNNKHRSLNQSGNRPRHPSLGIWKPPDLSKTHGNVKDLTVFLSRVILMAGILCLYRPDSLENITNDLIEIDEGLREIKGKRNRECSVPHKSYYYIIGDKWFNISPYCILKQYIDLKKIVMHGKMGANIWFNSGIEKSIVKTSKEMPLTCSHAQLLKPSDNWIGENSRDTLSEELEQPFLSKTKETLRR